MNEEQKLDERKQKRIYIFIIILAIVCVSGPLHLLAIILDIDNSIKHGDYGLQQSQDQIVAMYLVDAISPENYEILKEIPLSEKEKLIKNLNNLSFYEVSTINKYPNTYGIGFLIQYSDGGYDIVSRVHPCNCVVEDGRISHYCSKNVLSQYDHLFEELIYEYSTN